MNARSLAPSAVGLAVPALLGLGLVLAVPPVLEAQSLTSGVVSGEIRDGTAALDGVTVTLSGVAGGVERVRETGRGGRFRFDLVPPGAYVVTAERFGFRPKRVREVRVGGGIAVSLDLDLIAQPPPVEETDEATHRPGPLEGARAGFGHGLTAVDLRGLPFGSGHLGDVFRYLGPTGVAGATLGLPAELSGVFVDGLRGGVGEHPMEGRGRLATVAYPVEFFERVEFVRGEVDVERGGVAGGGLHGTTRRGTPDLEVEGSLAWSGSPVRRPGFPGDELPSHQDARGTLLVTGPIRPDTAHYAVGLHLRREAEPLPTFLDPDRDGDAAFREVLAERTGSALARFWSPSVAAWNTAAVFSRVDWQLHRDHRLEVRTHMGGILDSDGDLFPDALSGRGTAMTGADFETAAALTSRFSDELGMEMRVGFETGEREYGLPVLEDSGEEGDGGFEGPIPPTTAVTVGRSVGSGLGVPGAFGRRTFRMAETFHLRLGEHQTKFGLELSATRHSIRSDLERHGVFRFGDPADLAAVRGAFDQRVGAHESTDFTMAEISFFGQNAWSPTPGVEVTAGVRFDVERLPVGDIERNDEWEELTGVDNAAVAASAVSGHVSPRLGFTWDVANRSGWIVYGRGGIHTQGVAPGVMAEVLSHTGSVMARRGVGRLHRWPEVPDSVAAPVQGPILSILGPEFRGPRTQFGTVGVRRTLGRATSLELSGVVSRTEFLPRRRDLNRLPEPRSTDQFGRPVYGELRQQGGLLAVQPGSDRRFREFDMVPVFEADGWAEHAGITLSVEHRRRDRLELFGSYTFSRTIDNRPGGTFAGAPLHEAPRVGELERWVESRSDLDVPHRLVVGGEWSLPYLIPDIRIGLRYRGESGRPFTPGFPRGVQVSGQLAAGQDPAYVVDIPAARALASEWDCLADRIDAWAERNGCRAPAVHDLDLRLTVRLFETQSGWAAVAVDAINLLGRDEVVPDHALYRVDPDRSVSRDIRRGRVTIPLVVNPGFGEPLFRLGSTRAFRIGVRVGF